MAAPTPGTVLMFLTGDPALARRRAQTPEAVGMMARVMLPATMFLGTRHRPPTPGSPDADAMYPEDQLACAQLVLDALPGLGRSVRFVDVNQAGDAQPLVDRFTTESDVFPVLVRADGSRLVGQEAFSKSSLRQFLAGA